MEPSSTIASSKQVVLGALLLLAMGVVNLSAGDPSDTAGTNNEAKNIAQMNCGAQIELITPEGQVAKVSHVANKDSDAAALIMEDDTVSCPLREGETMFVIGLPKAALLDRFSFVNENAVAKGELSIAVSNHRLPADSRKWTQVEGTIPFTNKRLFNLSMLGVEAKYVRLKFHVAKEGRIAALGLYGQQSLRQFAERQSHVMQVSYSGTLRNEETLNFNFTNLYARARVVFVSSGPQPAARRMIDDDTLTTFAFSPTDPQPTVVVELADRAQIHRVSALYKMRAGRLQVFLMDELLNDPADLRDLTPIATIKDNGQGKAAVNFNSRRARYVALRWTPEIVDVPTNNSDGAFELAEINAFGDVPLSLLNMGDSPELYAGNLDFRPGEGGPDFSNKLGTLADPPVISPVSP